MRRTLLVGTLVLSVSPLILESRARGVEVEVNFEGDVILTDLPGFSRGERASGRVIYDTAAPGAPVSERVGIYAAVRSFELQVGRAHFAMTGGPGELTLFEPDLPGRFMALRSEPMGISGPPMAGFTPLSLNLGLLARSAGTFPSLLLNQASTKFGAGEIDLFEAETAVGIMYQSGGDVVLGAAISLRTLSARPIPPPRGPFRNVIRLEDIVAGGDGSGNAPPQNIGIDPRTGAFARAYIDGVISDTDGVNPSPVPASPYIDSVFFLKGQTPTAQDGCAGCFIQKTTQSGVPLLLEDKEETNLSWNHILKNRTGGLSTPGISAGTKNHFTTSIGLHASAGITFDLDALRDRHGAGAVGCFSAYWGLDHCPTGHAQLYALLSNDAQGITGGVVRELSAGSGGEVTLPIPPSARYLTLISASFNGTQECDRGTFARPLISPGGCAPYSDTWILGITPSRVAPGGEDVLVDGERLLEGFSVRVGGFDLLNQTSLGSTNTQRRGRTPALAPGVHDAEVVMAGVVIHRLPRAVEVAPAPVIAAVTPDKVLGNRRTLVQVVGQNFFPDMEVVIPNSSEGSAPLINQEFQSPQLITGRMPLPVDPRTAVSGTNTVYLKDQGRLRSFPVPLLFVEHGIERVEPDLVPTRGGSPVKITGDGFEPGMTFLVGTRPLLNVVVLDSGTASGKTPLLPAGKHALSLVNQEGSTLSTLPGAIQASPAPAARITGVLPLQVSTRGGDLLALATDGWHGGATPRIGGRPLANVDASEPTVLRGETPPLSPGHHTVDLVDGDGVVVSFVESAVEASAPIDVMITSVAPVNVAVGGGTPITLTGSGFEPGLIPRLGGIPLSQVEIIDQGHLRGLSPRLSEGLHDASITEGDSERARFPDAVVAIPFDLPAPPVIGRPAASTFAAGTDRISISAAGIPANAVLRVGGVPVVAEAPRNACETAPGAGGGGAIAGDGRHAVFAGKVPELDPGRYAVDFYLPGQGVVATLDEAVVVAAPTTPPAATHVVSADVLADGSTRLHIFGRGFAATTRFVLGGKPLVDPVVVSSCLAVGYAPALAAGEPLGPRKLELADPRGMSAIDPAVVYVAPKPPPGPRFIRADANQSAVVDISDGVTILGFLFLGSPSRLDCLESADVDANGDVDISDAIGIFGYLFLGSAAPQAPYPACGESSAATGIGCERFTACAAGGGGVATGLKPNVFVLQETRSAPGEPILRDVSPVSNEVIIDDPPGGVDLKPGDVITGFVPVASEAIHEGLTYMVRIGREQSRSCLSQAASDRTYAVEPADLADVFIDAAIDLQMPDTAADVRLASDVVVATGNTRCDLAEQAGQGGEDQGGGGQFKPLVDVDFHGVNLFGWQDGSSYIYAGFDRLRVLYAASEASLGVGISNGGLTRMSYFSGLHLDTEIEVYLDSHFDQHIEKETRLLTIRKDHIVVVYGVPIHFAATGDLYAGVNLDAQVNLFAKAGAKGSFKAGVGFQFDGRKITNTSGYDPPSLSSIPNLPELSLNGSLVVKGYVRPETSLFAGILFRGLTANIKTRTEAYLRLHAMGELLPVPCFDWGLDAGLNVSLSPEIQLFGYDLFDPPPFTLLDPEEKDLLGGMYGCKGPPIPRVSYSVVPLGGQRYEVRLDATASEDPDGGPLRFRWDFDADGQCDRATLNDPRTSAVIENVCEGLPFQVSPFDICERGRIMILRVTDDENVSVEHRFKVVLR